MKTLVLSLDWRKWHDLAASLVQRRIYSHLMDAVHELVARKLNAILENTPSVVYSIDETHVIITGYLSDSTRTLIEYEITGKAGTK